MHKICAVHPSGGLHCVYAAVLKVQASCFIRWATNSQNRLLIVELLYCGLIYGHLMESSAWSLSRLSTWRAPPVAWLGSGSHRTMFLPKLFSNYCEKCRLHYVLSWDFSLGEILKWVINFPMSYIVRWQFAMLRFKKRNFLSSCIFRCSK